MPEIHPEAQRRLDELEERWVKTNSNQKATITRLMTSQQRVREILDRPHSKICSAALQEIREALE